VSPQPDALHARMLRPFRSAQYTVPACTAMPSGSFPVARRVGPFRHPLAAHVTTELLESPESLPTDQWRSPSASVRHIPRGSPEAIVTGEPVQPDSGQVRTVPSRAAGSD